MQRNSFRAALIASTALTAVPLFAVLTASGARAQMITQGGGDGGVSNYGGVTVSGGQGGTGGGGAGGDVIMGPGVDAPIFSSGSALGSPNGANGYDSFGGTGASNLSDPVEDGSPSSSSN